MKTLFITAITIFLSVSTFAQKPDKDKVKTLKVAHITEQLNLSTKEAQAFWPIYNANEEANNKLRDASKLNRLDNIDAISEAEAKAHLDTIITTELSRQKLQKEYYSKLNTVLSSKKILKLMTAERTFRRKMIQEFKNRHRGDKNKN